MVDEWLTRVYISKTARTAHLLDRAICGRMPLCGMVPAGFLDQDWSGTGSQQEEERAAALPLCKRCTRVAGSRYAVIGEEH